jgi:outer membrane beta-barrel protein
MKKCISLLIFLTLGLSFYIQAEEATELEKKLQSLELPNNQTPEFVNSEKVYMMKDRLKDLTFTHEISMSGGRDFSSNGNLNTNMLGAAYRFHFNNLWAVKIAYGRVYNELNSTGRNLFERNELIRDSDYVKNFYDLGVEVNMFYGKFRLSEDRSQYFDNYLTVGARQFETRNGGRKGPYADIGLAFWFGPIMSLRVGIDNSIYKAQTEFQTRNEYVLTGHLDIGFVLGGK